ncbi:MAG: hypothetical protein D3904_00305, partial [Candidatus Electrothrix sp. EH2]|nr:hypothetical protein [Candidatus Electrothrix sp. EH2]
GDLVLRSGNGAGEDDAPRSIWLLSGSEDAGTKASAQFSQGNIEILSGEGEDNYIRLISGAGGGGGGGEAEEESEEEADEETEDETAEKESDDKEETSDNSDASSDGGMAAIELKQGTVTIQSGDAQITLSNGEIKLSGQITIEGAPKGDVMVDSDSKIILG